MVFNPNRISGSSPPLFRSKSQKCCWSPPLLPSPVSPLPPPFTELRGRRQGERNLLSSRGGLLQREGRGQVRRGGGGGRRQGVLQQGLQRLRRLHQLRKQC